ncbi:hypothetical protein V8C86DRAFT_3137521 [Haematococcus lacustris]
MYDPHSLGCRSLEMQPELLVAALRLADQWQADLVVMAAARALSASTASWPWFTTVAILDLPQALLASPQVRPLQRRAMEEVVSNLGNLELAWTKPELRGKLMALPIDAVEQLLVGRDLQVASENTVLTALTDYVETGRGAMATPRQLAGLLQACRLHHCSSSFFLHVLLARPWVIQAAAVIAVSGDSGSDESDDSDDSASLADSSDDRGSPARHQLPLPSLKPRHSASAACGSGTKSVSEGGASVTTSDSNLTVGCSSLSSVPLGRLHHDDAAVTPALPASSLSSLSACLTHSAVRTGQASRGLPSQSVPVGRSRGPRQKAASRKGPSTGLLQLVSQFALAKGGCLDAARATGVLGSGRGVPDALTEQARPDGDGTTAGVLTLEVPVHKLRAEMEALMKLRTRSTSSSSLLTTSAVPDPRSNGQLGGATSAVQGGSPRNSQSRRSSGPVDSDDTAGTASAGGSGSISSPNLVPSPTVVWAGWVWALDIFVARDPDEPVLGVSVHVLYPALGLPCTLPPAAPPLPDIHAMLGAMMSQPSPDSTMTGSRDSPESRAVRTGLFMPRSSLSNSSAGLPRVRTGRHLPSSLHPGYGPGSGISSLRAGNVSSPTGAAPPGASHAFHRLPPTGSRSSPRRAWVTDTSLAGGTGGSGQPSRLGYGRSPNSLLPASALLDAARYAHTPPSASHAPVPAAGSASTQGTASSRFETRAALWASSSGGAVEEVSESAQPEPLPPPAPPTGTRSWAVSADVRLCVYDHELEQWVHIYPQLLRTNTGLELVTAAPAPPSRRTTAGSGSLALPVQDAGSRRSGSGRGVSNGGSEVGAGSRGSSAGGAAMPSQSTVPFHADRYKVTYTDYYSVWAGPNLAKVVNEPLSWQRRAYAPDGRLKVKVELVSSR